MTRPEQHSSDGVTRLLTRTVVVASLVGGLAGMSIAVALSPMLLRSVYDGGDWTQQADLGQAYGAASAMLATVALGVVGVSLVVQWKQFRHTQWCAQRKRTTEVVQLALQEPRFMQCWGSCFSPQQVDERLFVYTNLVVLTWLSAYEHRLLKDPQAREYLKVFFDSEIPRMYWERHGDWHRPRRRLTRSDRFFALVNDEYLTAIKAGPPSREHEPMTRVHHT